MNNNIVLIVLGGKDYEIKYNIAAKKKLEAKFNTPLMKLMERFGSFGIDDIINFLSIGSQINGELIKKDELEKYVDEYQNDMEIFNLCSKALYFSVFGAKKALQIIENPEILNPEEEENNLTSTT
mgnify:CR=1 FL=1